MTERPILFSGAMVRAILRDENPKTQTRRIVDRNHLRVRLGREVSSDLPKIVKPVVRAKAGIHRATMNHIGAVSVCLPDGSLLGVKPGEFDFEYPFGSGKTHLGDFGGRKAWVIVPTEQTRLWVRERIWERPERTPQMIRAGADTWPLREYDADLDYADREQLRKWGWRSRPSIHMPRAACRVFLDVVSVRVERLRSISEADAKAEGVDPCGLACSDEPYRDGFCILWDRINGERAAWDTNPWVWVVEFRKVEG